MSEIQSASAAVPLKNSRHFLSQEIDFNTFGSLKPVYENLSARTPLTIDELKAWLRDLSELDAAVSEHLGWLYIRMTCNTQDYNAGSAYSRVVS